jgi:hypothetical protein
LQLLVVAKYFIVLGAEGRRLEIHPWSVRMKLSAIMRQPSAFLPVTMSLLALATLLVAFVTGGLVRETDEGTAAHIWQLLMGGQMPIVAYFAIKWLPQAPRQALYVLALQVGIALAALAPVFILKL